MGVTFRRLISKLFPSVQIRQHSKCQKRKKNLCISGTKQSPIKICRGAALPCHDLKPLRFDNFKPKVTGSVSIDYTVNVTLDVVPHKRPFLSGGGLDSKYVLNGFHFHWPSEHSVFDGISDMEGHFVFYNDTYPDFEEAMGDEEIAVVGVLYNMSPTAKHNKAFNEISEAAYKASPRPGVVCSSYDSVQKTHSFSLMELLPKANSGFYSYKGSLTRPPCVENIPWYIFNDYGTLSRPQYMKITSIYDKKGKQISSNSRNLQPLNGRNYFFTHQVHESFVKS